MTIGLQSHNFSHGYPIATILVPLDRVFSTLFSGILYEFFPTDMRCTPTSTKFPMSLKAFGDIIREQLQIYPTILTEYARE